MSGSFVPRPVSWIGKVCVESLPGLSKIQPASRRHQARPTLDNVPPLLRRKIGALAEVQFLRGNLHLITLLAEDGAQGDR